MADGKSPLIAYTRESLPVAWMISGTKAWRVDLSTLEIEPTSPDDVPERAERMHAEAAAGTWPIGAALLKGWIAGRKSAPRKKMSAAQIKANRENGKRGGRPRKTKKGEEK